MIVDSVTVTGVVKSVDKAASSVTLIAPEKEMTFEVEDTSLLDKVAPGDAVSATYIRVISGEVKSR